MKRGRRSRAAVIDDDDDENVPIAEDDNEDENQNNKESQMFSSQLPEMSQEIVPAKAAEKANLMKLSETARGKAITDLTRLVLFKAMAGDPIDRTKCPKEAGIPDGRISAALFNEVNDRLSNLFGFELRRIPAWMDRMKSLPKKYKDRYYVVNSLKDDGDASHSRAIHGVHVSSAVEKGFLMVVLALTYCKGAPHSDGSRWILDKDLYALLHKLEENIPHEPPVGSKKRTATQQFSQRQGEKVHSQSPDVDGILEKFCQRDYLIKEKATEQQIAESNSVEESSYFYTMGPRAAMEIGRRQVIYFCSEILDEEPDPTMLSELETAPEEEEAA